MRKDGSQVFHVSDTEAGLGLVEALQLWRPGRPSTEATEVVRERRVQIDGNLCQDKHRRLKSGEVVKVLPHAIAAPPSESDIRIVFADEHVVVVEKPSGMTTMRHDDERTWSGRRQRREATLDDLLPRVLASFLGETDVHSGRVAQSRRGTKRPPPQSVQRVRVIPVHRLDRETSGLMVFARTPAAERSLVEQFREHSIDRAYLAIVCGEIDEQTFESYFIRDRGDGKRGSTTQSDVGQHAVTHVRPVEILNGYTLIECRLETGRTHQIRIHLSEAGHPVCGDKEYRGPLGSKPIPDRSGAPRLALHAAELGFEHPRTHQPLHFSARLPRELAQFLTRLRRSG